MNLTRRSLLAAPALALSQQTGRRRHPPNVLLIITDDQGYGDLSLHGNTHLKTPNLDSIGREGVQFTQFQVCPVCSPTRSSLMTGRYNYRTGVVDTFLGRSMMHADEVTMPEIFAKAGYRTGIFGKWHLGDNYPMRSIDQGFQESLVCNGGGVGQPSDPPGTSYFDPILQHNGKAKHYEGYCTDIFADAAMAYIERNRRDPWFAYLSTNAPHTPLTVREEWAKPYLDAGLDETTAKVYAMVANVDANVGRVLAKLRTLDLERDTIVVYLTDNGPQQRRYNSGMRGLKGTVYQGGIRVPCFLRWPGQVRAGSNVDRIAAHIDLLPTLAEACGVKLTDGPTRDGRSLMPLVRGETGAWRDRTLFTQWHRGDEPELFRACAARTQRYKLVDGRELYDLQADPAEAHDISKERPEVAAELRGQTEAWFRDVSSSRGYAPPRIHLGTRHENPTILTRQDWRGPRASWDDKGLGYWEVDVRAAGRYRIGLRMAPAPGDGEARVSIGEAAARRTIKKGATGCDLGEVTLASGPARVEPAIDVHGQIRGVHYVDVQKL
jgi:arylsulfatase A-like enzyme